MPVALICTQAELEGDLGHTLLWRAGMERHVATRLEEARMMAVAARPDIVIVDRELPRSDQLVAALREDPSTRGLSIVVAAPATSTRLGERGMRGHALLRCRGRVGLAPSAPAERPRRRQARFTVDFDVEAVVGGTEATSATALNLSVSGMLLESPVGLAVGDEVQLRFQIPDSEHTVATTARVVRVAAPGQYGVEFGRVEGGTSERLRAFVTGAAGPEPAAS